MKTVILGGGSFSTPALFSALGTSVDPLSSEEFVLVGRTAEHLKANVRAATLVSGVNRPVITAHCCDPATADRTLRGADVVLVQIRAGGFEGRIFDESFPLRFGLCGDEGLGPGGLSAALRGWPVLKPWLAAIEKNAPQALVIMVSSPVGILVRAAHACFPNLRCYGICEVPYVCLRDVCSSLGVARTATEFDYLGINHLGWLYNIQTHNRNLTAEWAKLTGRAGFPAAAIIQTYGGVPTKYLRLHFEREQVLREQQSAAESRGAALRRLRDESRRTYRCGDVIAIREFLSRRQTPWYSDAIAPLLLGLFTGHTSVPLFLSAPNEGYSGHMSDRDILEMPYHIVGRSLIRCELRTEPPEPIRNLVRHFCRYERLATDAVLQGTEAALAHAIAEHPWVENTQAAASLAQVIVSQALPTA